MFDVIGKIELNPTEQILLAHHLAKNGDGQKYFTHQVRKFSDPYVPFDTGELKNTAVEKEDRIEYIATYSRRQWNNHRGAGRRGPRWTLRAWAVHRKDIVRNVAKYCGGKAN